MRLGATNLDATLTALDERLSKVTAASARPAIERFIADSAALRFHLRERGDRRPIIAILGGTGTGKSTLLNRLLDANVSASSFRRTYTAGSIAVAASMGNLPLDWLGVPHAVAKETPARGEADRLMVVTYDAELTRAVTIVDTPDLDGDQPAHHAQADRAFRWADGVVMLVTPEKYQMPELTPYYRLARRYAIAALFVMNKVEQQAVADDYRTKLNEGIDAALAPAGVFAIARDDSTFEPGAGNGLVALRDAIRQWPAVDPNARSEGLRHRSADLLDRLHDQILSPLMSERREADQMMSMLRGLETPASGIDVNPITRSLARRLQQRSILYLIGPGRILDRVRQAPALLARLPRSAWDLVMHGKMASADDAERLPRELPDFQALLAEQLAVLQSRIDDVIRSTPIGTQWIERDAAGYGAAVLDKQAAAAIADDELNQLKEWLERRWNATPRDTAMFKKALKYVPGGEKLTQWSEAAPYLLTIIVAAHHAFFGHVDLLILGGYSLATWLTERISNEVAARTRQANRSIAQRFERLAHEQIEITCQWLDARTPAIKELQAIRNLAESMGETA